MATDEYSDAGNPIYRYDDVKPKAFTPAIGNGDNIESISAHIERYIGKIDMVLHEVVSDLVHIDVHWVKPTEDFPFHSLITSGMSDKAMNVPEGAEVNKYMELCILLPASWDLGINSYDVTGNGALDETSYWPIRFLKILARFPHEYDTWLGYGHTIPNGPEAASFAENTKLGCMLVLPAISLSNEFFELTINEGKTIHFYCLYPIYKEEMEFKLKKGSDALIDKFEKFQVTDIVDINRKNTCAKKGLFGLW